MVAIRCTGIEKRFGTTVVLDGVSLEVPDGAFAVLVGPSGCGKSTLLRLLAGLEQADRGTIHFGSRDVGALEPRARDIAMVFQSYALYPHLSVRDNLAFGLRLRKTPKDVIAERVREVSAMLGLDKLLDRMPRELSGGQRQRVAMGRAIARRAQLFLFDEPLSNLDASLRAAVRVDIRSLHLKLRTTSVYVTHDQVEAMTLADVMFVLNKGRIEQSGVPLAIYERPETRFVAGFLGSPAMNFLEAEVGRAHDGEGVALHVGAGPAEREPGGVLALARAELGWPVREGDTERLAAALAPGQKVTLGVRPHDFIAFEADDAAAPTDADAATYRSTGELGAAERGALEARVVLCEALGGETYAHATIGAQPVVVRLAGSQRLEPGAPLRVRPQKIHLFDATSGKSLAPP